MEEEAAKTKLQQAMTSSKEFISKGYYCFADYISKTYTKGKEKGYNFTFKMVLAKYILIALNIGYMLISLLMINVGIIGLIANNEIHFVWSRIDMLSLCWIATGAILLFVALLGLIGAFRESIIWTNIFGVLLTVVFVLQISSAIAAFTLIGRSNMIAWNGINSLMTSYSYSYGDGWISARDKMDWIQKTFKCCGNDNPSDWNSVAAFIPSTEDEYDYKQRIKTTTVAPVQLLKRKGAIEYDYDYRLDYHPPTTTTTVAPVPLVNRIPSSCCTQESNYNNLTCDKYYQSGCVGHLRDVISESVMIVGSVALIIAVTEILGIAFAFIAARLMRKTKSYRQIQRYNALGGDLLNADVNALLKNTKISDEDDQIMI